MGDDVASLVQECKRTILAADQLFAECEHKRASRLLFHLGLKPCSSCTGRGWHKTPDGEVIPEDCRECDGAGVEVADMVALREAVERLLPDSYLCIDEAELRTMARDHTDLLTPEEVADMKDGR